MLEKRGREWERRVQCKVDCIYQREERKIGLRLGDGLRLGENMKRERGLQK